jgi:hypothetical protein
MTRKRETTRPGAGTTVHRLRALTGAAAQASGRTHPYSEQERQEAIALADEVGVRAASERLGIPEQTILHFRNKAARDLRAARADYLASGGTLAEGEQPPDWRTQREAEANAAGLDARIVRDCATEAMLEGNAPLVRAGAAYYLALASTAQALTAGRVAPKQTPEDVAEEVRRMRETLDERRAQLGGQAS